MVDINYISVSRRPRLCIMILVVAISVLCISDAAFAADIPIDKILPSPECGPGWVMEEKVRLYNKDNLFDRINGEAELYFPYGFEALVSARYTSSRNPKASLEADVYKMGSTLDAFGIYAGYRRSDDESVNAGAEGTISPSLALFYQDRYFVRLQAGGVLSLDKEIFLSCARAISKKLPPVAGTPKELEAFRKLSQIVQKSERYLANSLLGYAFFQRGLIADAMLEGKEAQVFIVLGDSPAAARSAFDQYRSYLGIPEKDILKADKTGYIYISATDPLYRQVIVAQSGRYIFGLVRVQNISAAKKVIDQIIKILPG
jgi:hypothetical protein